MIAVNLSWAQPGRFHNGDFIGGVRSLMVESSMVDILPCAFGGVVNMFTGNKCPQNFRALRQLVETVIQNTVQEANDDDDDKIQR